VVIIDSSILVAVERGHLELKSLRETVGASPIGIAAITASELLHGVHRARTARQRAIRDAFVERLLSALPVLPFDLTVARVHSRIWAELAAQGITVGAHDLIIAATAMANGGDLATRDERSFPRIPGLTVLRW
jgi:predicted nucleic acid-binding protein